jgi:sRNA-binding regulator protein Hfq
MLLGRGSQVQLVYKHAVSTMQPATSLQLGAADPDLDAQEQEQDQ